MPRMTFVPGSRVRIPNRPDLRGHVRIELATAASAGWQLFVEESPGRFQKVDLTGKQAAACETLTENGGGDSTAVLAGLWTAWMRAASAGARSATLASSPLKPYAHQMNAVYGAMLPQPNLRFLLANEPGTGKTIMAGMYLREMQRLGFVSRAPVVAPAHFLPAGWRQRSSGGGRRCCGGRVRSLRRSSPGSSAFPSVARRIRRSPVPVPECCRPHRGFRREDECWEGDGHVEAGGA
jgi:hypothetical protein